MALETQQETEDSAALEFEEARHTYCLAAFTRQEQQRELLDGKARFYLSIALALLGVVLLKPDYSARILALIRLPSLGPVARAVLFFVLGLFATTSVMSLVSILLATRLKPYKTGYPKKFADRMFLQDSDFLEDPRRVTLLQKVSVFYATAADRNRETNEKKAGILALCGHSLLGAVLALFALIGTLIVMEGSDGSAEHAQSIDDETSPDRNRDGGQ